MAISSYADAFGAQWRRYSRTQLDSYTGTTISRDRLRRCLGEELWEGLSGRKVLEAGCGAGRFTEVLLERGAILTSVDLSDAVVANAENFPPSETHTIRQADINDLPFEPGGFDVVVCLGVIQHTPSPEQTIRNLARQVRPGGWLVIDHYSYDRAWLSWHTKTAPLFRLVLKRVSRASPQRGLRATEAIVRSMFPLHRWASKYAVVSALLTRISPVQTYFRLFPQIPADKQLEWSLLDTHDSLTDWFKHFRTKAQIRRAMEAAGVTPERCEYGGNGVEARGRRTAAS